MSLKKINTAVLGATGYVGLDLLNLLTKHPNVNIKYLCAQKGIGKSISFFDKKIKKRLPKISNLNKIDWTTINLVFLSLPDSEAQKLIKNKIKYSHLKFIDLSADFRLNNSKDYKKWYNIKHKAKKLIPNSIYSIPELTKSKINKFRIIGNPGCYPTSILLPLIPVLKKRLINNKNIIIDSKSGYSGAGKNYVKKFKHKNIYSSIQPYSTFKHRHVAEIDQQLVAYVGKNIRYTFTPHLLPTFRGILSSIHVELPKHSSIKKINNELKKFYKNKSFVNILKINEPIGTSNVINSNYCEISVCKTRYKNRIIIFSALDNLIKGASGQAIQNMNALYNFKETKGFV